MVMVALYFGGETRVAHPRTATVRKRTDTRNVAIKALLSLAAYLMTFTCYGSYIVAQLALLTAVNFLASVRFLTVAVRLREKIE
jgi:hypothetical protein